MPCCDPRICRPNWKTLALIVAFPVSLALGQGAGLTESAAHPDAARDAEARRVRLEIFDQQMREAADREQWVEARREVVALQLAVNGWSIIIKPNGAVALIRPTGEGRAPVAAFAPAGTVEFGPIRARMQKQLTAHSPARSATAIVAGFRIKGEARVFAATIYDTELWNGIVDAAEPKLEEPERVGFTKLVEQFPLHLPRPIAVAK